MRFRRVSSVGNKSLACVGLMVAFYALAGNACLAQERIDRSIKYVEPVDNSLVDCLEPCDDSKCIEDCIATKPLPMARRVTFRSVPKPSVTDCFSDVKDNISVCGQAFLVPFEDADWESFSYCRAVATMVFAGCPAFESSLDPTSTLEIGTFCLDQTVQITENTIAQAQAGQLEPLARRLARRAERGVSSDELQFQKDASALTQQAGDDDPVVVEPPSFEYCVGGFMNNTATCRRLIPDNGDADNNADRKVCLGAAKMVLGLCVGAKFKDAK